MSGADPNIVFTQAYIAWLRDGVEAPSLKMLQDCLMHAQDMGQPLPDLIVSALIQSVDNLLCGRTDSLLRKADVQRDSHSMQKHKQFAVGYIKTCKKHGYDDHPVKTVGELFGVDSRTVRRWKKEYASTNDVADKNELLFQLKIHSLLYRENKGMGLHPEQEDIRWILKP